jgi:hypothetical protein
MDAAMKIKFTRHSSKGKKPAAKKLRSRSVDQKAPANNRLLLKLARRDATVCEKFEGVQPYFAFRFANSRFEPATHRVGSQAKSTAWLFRTYAEDRS